MQQATFINHPHRSVLRGQRMHGLAPYRVLGLPALGRAKQRPFVRRTARIAHMITKSAAQQASRMATSVPVRFSVQREVKYGESLVVVGDHPSLGAWKVRKAAGMNWSEGHVWHAEVNVLPGTSFEFKCVRLTGGKDDTEWEEGPNHVLQVPASGVSRVSVEVSWSGEVAVKTEQGGQWEAAPPQQPAAEQRKEHRKEKAQRNGATPAPAVTVSVASSSGSSFDERPGDAWQGRQIKFMSSNEHSQERQGVWNTHGLQGTLLRLVEGDRDNGSWLGKLAVVKHLLVDSAPRQRPDLDTLAAVYIYMQWIATGAVPCVESGGHQRPNRHAELARVVFRSLEWAIEEATTTAKAGREAAAAAARVLVARRLHTRLPSFTEQFTQSVPLTRIRDIAHRNDIPSHLKQEIKHTIQNKLHRNAGPEDLVATEAMLARITEQPGQYNDAFVSEFRIFTAELRDFFNAASLGDLLAAIQTVMDDSHVQLINRFMEAKSRLDSAGPDANQNLIMDALHGITSVRALLAASLSSGLRNDAPDKAMAMRQRYRLCEVRAEDYAFVLLSRFFNSLEQKGGAGALASGNDGTWALPIGALVLGVRHVGLGGFESGECMAVEQELAAWQKAGGLKSRDNALRLRGTLQRLQRLTEEYVHVLLDSYTQRSEQLGAALGLDPYMVSIFPEAEVRASVVFQLSKLCSLMLRATGMVAGGGEWEVIMGGEARGVLIAVDQLQPGCLAAAGGKDAVLLVRDASGDEEVAALGPQLKGIILRHAIPHLSHLGVRTRQERVPFVCCEEEGVLSPLTGPLMGKRVRLIAGAEGATLAADTEAPAAASTTTSSRAGSGAAKKPDPIQKVSGSMRVVSLEDATSATCGAKGAACGELLRLSKQCNDILAARAKEGGAGASSAEGNGDSAGALFEAPDGVCLPFGCMELALKGDGKQREFDSLMQRLERGGDGDVEETCRQLEALIRGLRIPQQVLQQVSAAFKPGGVVIARSSANVEDLAGMSGAGLYESIPNINSNDMQGLQDAICGVWASLFTRRAVLSRQAAGVPQGSACMAVVVQAMLAPDLSFVLHTAHPISRDPATLAAELAPGLGEILAAGTRGSGWRLEIDKSSGVVTTRSFANFSRALLPGGGDSGNGADAASGSASQVQMQLVDYSQQPMSASEDVRGVVGRRLVAVGRLLEHEFGGAQDVEGCFAGGQMYIVQSRPQP